MHYGHETAVVVVDLLEGAFDRFAGQRGVGPHERRERRGGLEAHGVLAVVESGPAGVAHQQLRFGGGLAQSRHQVRHFLKHHLQLPLVQLPQARAAAAAAASFTYAAAAAAAAADPQSTKELVQKRHLLLFCASYRDPCAKYICHGGARRDVLDGRGRAAADLEARTIQKTENGRDDPRL